jgi:hypothetical protein
MKYPAVHVCCMLGLSSAATRYPNVTHMMCYFCCFADPGNARTPGAMAATPGGADAYGVTAYTPGKTVAV